MLLSNTRLVAKYYYFGKFNHLLFYVPSTHDTDTLSSGLENMGIDSGEGRSSPRFIMPARPKEEPETIRKWREEQEMRLKEKDETEQIRMNELREQAKKELDDW